MATNNTTKIAMLTVLIVSAIMSGCVEDAPITTVEEIEVSTPTPAPTVTVTPTATPEPIVEPTPVVEPTPEPTPEVYMSEIGEAAKTEYLTVGVKSYEVMDKYQYMGYNNVEAIYPEFHHQFIIFDCIIANTGDKESVYGGSWDFSMEDQNGYRYDISSALWITDIEELRGCVELYPGQKIAGKIVFEIPTESTVNTLYYDFGSIFGTNLAGWNVTL